MAMEFNRLITLLRKEHGITQKQAAQDLGISQALLSHYEKGIRECGLEFVVKVADYYGVSCDYLLGRSPERTGTTLTVEDIPAPESSLDNRIKKGGVLPVMNKKLIANSMNILFDKLGESQNKALITEVSAYLMLSVYKMFRLVYSANPKNASGIFRAAGVRWDSYANAASQTAEANVKALLAGESLGDQIGVKDAECFAMTSESLAQQYGQFTISLMNLIKTSETRLEK